MEVPQEQLHEPMVANGNAGNDDSSVESELSGGNLGFVMGDDDDDSEEDEDFHDELEVGQFTVGFDQTIDPWFPPEKENSNLRHVPKQMIKMIISGSKSETNPLHQKLLSFLETDCRLWNEIELNGHPDDEPRAFSVLLAKCLCKTNKLMLFGMFDQTHFDALLEGFHSASATVQNLILNIRVPVTNGIASNIAQLLAIGRLEQLDLCGNFIEPGNSAIIAEGLQQSKALRTLNLVWVEFEAGGFEAIFNSLQNKPHFKTLNLRSTTFLAPDDAVALGSLISSSSCNIERLEFWFDSAEPNISNGIMDNLSQSISTTNSALKELQLRRWGFDDLSMASLFNIVDKLPSLIALELQENRLSSLQQVAALVARMSQVNTLRLCQNSITPSTIHLEDFMNALQLNDNLENLDNLFDLNHDLEAAAMEAIPKIAHLLCINKAGRRLINQSNGFRLPSSMWPLILERCFRMDYDPHWMMWNMVFVGGGVTSKEKFDLLMGANAAFHMLRDGEFLFET